MPASKGVGPLFHLNEPCNFGSCWVQVGFAIVPTVSPALAWLATFLGTGAELRGSVPTPSPQFTR